MLVDGVVVLELSLEVELDPATHHDAGDVDERLLIGEGVETHRLLVVSVHDDHSLGTQLLGINYFDAKGATTAS